MLYPYEWFDIFAAFIVKSGKRGRQILQRKRLQLHSSIFLGDVTVSGNNVDIGENTYFNSGYISSGNDAKVKIGKWTAIGYNVSIVAYTHSAAVPTGPENIRPVQKGNISIGNGVWIGNNVVVAPGVSIGDFCVVGANSVVTSDLPENTICVGSPCKVVKIKDDKDITEHKKIIGL